MGKDNDNDCKCYQRATVAQTFMEEEEIISDIIADLITDRINIYMKTHGTNIFDAQFNVETMVMPQKSDLAMMCVCFIMS